MKSKGTTRLHSKKHRAHEDRIAYIHHAIRSGRYPTIEDLMRETGVRRGAILEDIQYLKEFKGLPVKVSRAQGRNGGYYYTRPVAEKISNTFNERGVLNMALAHRSVATLPVKGDEKLGLDMETISQWMVPHTKILMDEMVETVFFRPFAPEEMAMNTFVTVSEAMRERREMNFLYEKNLAPRPELKRVQGHCFVSAANCFYVIGRDVEKNEDRTYLLSRMSQPLITDVKFKDPKFDLDEYLKGAFIVMKGNESHDIELEFTPWARTYIENRTFTYDQKMEVLPNGGLRLRFWLSCLEEVEYWVRHWGPHVRVIGSEGLKERLRRYRDYLQYLG